MPNYGISYELTLDWIDEQFESIEFSDDYSDYLYEDTNFYVFEECVDEQDSNYTLIKDEFKLEIAEEALFKNKIVVESFIRYVEEQLFQIVEEGDFINYIKLIK